MSTTTSLTSLVRQLRFKHLQLLYELDRSRNLHAATRQMTVTQPAATKILHDTEDLFELEKHRLDIVVGRFATIHQRRAPRQRAR
jgi:hypothetical protein